MIFNIISKSKFNIHPWLAEFNMLRIVIFALSKEVPVLRKTHNRAGSPIVRDPSVSYASYSFMNARSANSLDTCNLLILFNFLSFFILFSMKRALAPRQFWILVRLSFFFALLIVLSRLLRILILLFFALFPARGSDFLHFPTNFPMSLYLLFLKSVHF